MNGSLHPVLQRQLRRAGMADVTAGTRPEQLEDLLMKVSEAYAAAESDRYLLERSLDISSREMQELNGKLGSERNQLDALLNAIGDGICALGAGGEVTWGNAAAGLLLGLDPNSTCIFNLLANLQTSADPSGLAAKSGNSTQQRGEIETLTGERIPVSYRRNFLSIDSQPGPSVMVFRDIREELGRERDLLEAREAADAASRAKTNFLANMSHELRTPMNGVLGMTELVLHTDLTTEQREYLALTKSSAESLLAILNDILDFSKIEAGKMTLMPFEFTLRETLENVMKTVALTAHRKHVELLLDVGEGVPVIVFGDGLRLRQVLLNLVGNALKFTECGEVELSAKLLHREGEECVLSFAVRDTGIGMSDEQLTRIFDPFVQVDNSASRAYSGTGLGLAISMELAKLLGGNIQVQSRPGEGSCFVLTTPLEVSTAITLAHIDPPDFKTLRILLVDDNAASLRILGKMLAGWGLQSKSTGSGTEALHLLKDAETTGSPFDLLLVDGQIPELDGLEKTEQFLLSTRPAGRLSADGLHGGLKVILLSSTHVPQLRDALGSLKIERVLTKPVAYSDLRRAITETCVQTVPEQTALRPVATPVVASRGRPLRILLAEDNPVNQRLAKTLLEKKGHLVTIANDGFAAVALSESGGFDLILMDVQMPGLDGLSATAEIRARPRMSTIPIIATTAHAMQGDREKCLAAGMDGYLTKPLNFEQLYRVVEQFGASARSEEERQNLAVR